MQRVWVVAVTKCFLSIGDDFIVQQFEEEL